MADEETTVVSAVGTASGGNQFLADLLQTALVESIERAIAEGVTDPDEIRQRQLDARDKVVPAMQHAVDLATASGITDADEVKRLMTAARDEAMR
jgi:hypothetical protein